MFTRRRLLLAAGAAPLAGLVFPRGAFADTASAPLKPYAIEDFFGRLEAYDTALSPNGKLISLAGMVKASEAGLVEKKIDDAEVADKKSSDTKKKGAKKSDDKADDDKKAADEEQAIVLVLDATDTSKVLHRFNSPGYNIQHTLWAKDDRLLIWLVVDFGFFRIRRIAAVNPDGSNSIVLFENKHTNESEVFDLGSVLDVLPDHPTDILMMAYDPAHKAPALWRVNVMTGEAASVEIGSAHTALWTLQDGVPMLRIDVNDRGDVLTVLARPPGQTDWKVAHKYRADQTPDFFIVGPTNKAGVFLVGARLEGEDTVSVRELDIATMSFGKPISSRPGSDAVGGLVDQYKRFTATTYMNDRIDYDFVDPALAPHYRGVNTFFDHACNVQITDIDRNYNRFLFTATGPQEPGGLFLYDRAATQVVRLGVSRPDLAPERLASTETLTVKTRDGGKISAYLSAPIDKKPGPLVVMPHGGPEIRDSVGFDIWVQVLAAQGWWVLQPNFRGSGGYGLEFAKAGWRQWDGRMQQDIDDAVDQAIALRGLDHARVAIMGASYGGYASLMGALRRPDLYKAAISIAGPADLMEMLRYERAHDETSDHEHFGFWSARIGDPDKDKAQIANASPRHRASEYLVPMLLIHGSDDKIVPVSQSREMNRALKEAGKSVEFLEVKDVGHPSWPDDEEKTMLHRAVDFVKKGFA